MRRSSLLRHLTASLALVLGLVLGLGLTACSNGQSGGPGGASAADSQSNPPVRGQAAPYITSVPNSEADSTAERADLNCDLVSGECPDALAMALTRVNQGSRTDFYQCTAFLITKDLVATNVHCLPEDLRSVGARCDTRMHFYFGQNSRHRKFVATCGQIISVSSIEKNPAADDFNLRPDLAVIRLTKPVFGRQPLPLSQEGVADEMDLKLLSVDPVDHSADRTEAQAHEIRGQAHVRTCVAKQRSLMTPQFTNDFGSVVAAACSVVQGNSGSPALDANGRVRAVLHARRSSDMISAKNFSGFELPASFVDMAELTNISCADFSPTTQTEAGIGAAMSSCRAPIPARDQLIRSLEESNSVDVQIPYQDWLTHQAPTIFETDLEDFNQPGFRGGVPRFTCVQDPQIWLTKSSHDLRLDSVVIAADHVTLETTIPLWGSKAQLDRFERASAVARALDRAHTSLSFDLSFVKTNGFVRFSKISKTESGQLIDPQGRFDLKICP